MIEFLGPMPKSRFDLRQKVIYAEFRFICQTGAAGVLLQVQPKGNMCKALGCTVYSLIFFPSDPNARLPSPPSRIRPNRDAKRLSIIRVEN